MCIVDVRGGNTFPAPATRTSDTELTCSPNQVA